MDTHPSKHLGTHLGKQPEHNMERVVAAQEALQAAGQLAEVDDTLCFSEFSNVVKEGLEKTGFESAVADKLVNLLKAKREKSFNGQGDAVLTGSFLLWLMEGCPATWKPGDVDVFTGKHDDVWFFKQAFGESDKIECGDEYYGYLTGGRRSANSTLRRKALANVNRRSDRLHYMDQDVVSVYTWNCVSTAGAPKLQLIWVRSRSSQQHVADHFDLDPLKLWFDGMHLCVPKTYNFGTRHTDLKPMKLRSYIEFNRLLQRCFKYAARGYSFRLPTKVTLPYCDSRMDAMYKCDKVEGAEHATYYTSTATSDSLMIGNASKLSWFAARFMPPNKKKKAGEMAAEAGSGSGAAAEAGGEEREVQGVAKKKARTVEKQERDEASTDADADVDEASADADAFVLIGRRGRVGDDSEGKQADEEDEVEAWVEDGNPLNLVLKIVGSVMQ